MGAVLGAAIVLIPRQSLPDVQDYSGAEDEGSPEDRDKKPGDREKSETGAAAGAAGAGKEERTKTGGGLIFIIIDDVGNNIVELEPFLKLPGVINFSVLPGLPYTEKAAELVCKSGHGLMLHQPMEAIGGADPGPGAIYAGMDFEEIDLVLEQNLAQIPGVSAVNNHMGSRITAELDTMRRILGYLTDRKTAFIDSYTTSDSVTQIVAEELKTTIYRRDIFLDNQQEKDYYTKAVEEAKEIAEKKGHAVLIGHVWSAGLAETLMELYPELVEEGFQLEEISRLTGLGDGAL